MIGVWSLNWSISEYSKLLYSKIKLENYWYFLFISLICHMFKYFISLQTYKLLHEVQHLYQYRKIKDKKTMAMNGIIIRCCLSLRKLSSNTPRVI